MILYIVAKDHRPGPQSTDRKWKIARWTGTEWLFHEITTALHNYDMGSICVEEDGSYKVIAPIGAGPQYWGTGGEIELWTSTDQGATWAKQRAVTTDSPRNHSYARRPRNAHPEFFAYWADGHAHSHLNSILPSPPSLSQPPRSSAASACAVGVEANLRRRPACAG